MNLSDQATQPLVREYRTIPLTRGQISKVDPADHEWLSQWKWYAAWRPKQRQFYAERTVSNPRRGILMHRLIMGEPSGLDVDHEDHDTLNNCRYNLRSATRSQNIANVCRLRNDNRSGVRGVSFDAKMKMWSARITVNGRYKFLGHFSDKQVAGDAYQNAARAIYGEFMPNDYSREPASEHSS